MSQHSLSFMAGRVRCAALLSGVLLALGGCVEPAYLGGAPYYEERNAYYEQRPAYVQPGYYGNYYGGSTYYRPAPRVDVYYYDRGRYGRHDDYRGRDYGHYDGGRRDYGRSGGGDRHRDDDRGHDRRPDPPVAAYTRPAPAAPPPASGSGRRELQWSRPAPGTPDSEGKNSWVPRPHY